MIDIIQIWKLLGTDKSKPVSETQVRWHVAALGARGQISDVECTYLTLHRHSIVHWHNEALLESCCYPH